MSKAKPLVIAQALATARRQGWLDRRGRPDYLTSARTAEPHNWKRVPAKAPLASQTKETVEVLSESSSSATKSAAIPATSSSEVLTRGKLVLSKREIDEGLSFDRSRGLLAKDVWLRQLDLEHRQQQLGVPTFRWDLEASKSAIIDSSISNNSTISNATPTANWNRQKQIKTAPTLAALKGVLTPNSEKYVTIAPLEEAFAAFTAESINTGYIYSHNKLVYIDVAKKRELSGTALKEFYQNALNEKGQNSVIPHPGPYSVPIRLSLAVPSPKISSRSSGSNERAVGPIRNLVETAFVLPRLELLPGLTGFVVGRQSSYAQMGRYVAQHPLDDPATGVRTLKVHIIENGPDDPVPLFLGNDDTYIGALAGEPIQPAKAVDLHGSVNFGEYMAQVLKLKTTDSDEQYVVSDLNSENCCRVYPGRQTLPISLANQAVYDILVARYGAQFKKLDDMESAAATARAPGKFTIPGVLEPVMVKKWYINTSHVRKAVAHHSAALHSHLLEIPADIPLVEADLSEDKTYRIGAAQLGLRTSDSSIEARVAAATGGVENGTAAFEWVSNVYNEAYAVESGSDTDGAPIPIVVDNTGGASVTEKLYLLCALLLHTHVLKHSPLVVLDQELRSTVTNLELLRARTDITLDGLRSTLAETFGDRYAAATALSSVSVRENMGILQLLYSLIQHLHGVAGVTVPLRAPRAAGYSATAVAAAVKPYERSTLEKLSQLHSESKLLFDFTGHGQAFDLRAAKRIVDQAVLTVAVHWAPFSHIDQAYEFNPTHSGVAGASYERALAHTAVTMRIFRMLHAFMYPLWPDLSRSLAHFFELRFKTSVLLSPTVPAPEDAVLSELTITKDDLAVFDNHMRILEAIERQVDSDPKKSVKSKAKGSHALHEDLSTARVPRRHYRGYLCVQDDPTVFVHALGASSSSRAAANDGPVLALKRVADVGVLTVPAVPTIFNTGSLGTTQITPDLQLRAFDARAWTTAAQAQGQADSSKASRIRSTVVEPTR